MKHQITGAQRVGRHVRAVLSERGMTQNELAQILGLTHASMTRRVVGHMSFRADELLQIADYLGVDPARFFRPIPEPRVREQPLGERVSARGAA